MHYTKLRILTLAVLLMAALAFCGHGVLAVAQDDQPREPEPPAAPADPFGEPEPSPFDNPPGESPPVDPFGKPTPGEQLPANPFGDPPADANPFGDANRMPDVAEVKPKPKRNPKPEIFVGDPTEDDIALRSGEAAIRKALRRKVTLRCEEDEPLDEVIARLRREHKIQIVLDWLEIEQILGIVPEETLVPACDYPGISFRSALEMMLGELELTWVIDRDVLLITTQEKADQMLTTKVHEVGDLVMYRDGQDRILADYDSLEEMITTSIRPESWDEVGGPGTISHHRYTNAESLVVRQTAEVHEELEKLLADIRAIARKNRARGGDSMPPLRITPQRPTYGGGMGGGGGGW